MMYGRTIFFFSVVLVLAFCNLILAFATLKNKAYKNVFTAFGSKGDYHTSCVNITKMFSAIVLPGAIFFSKVSMKYKNMRKTSPFYMFICLSKDKFKSRKETEKRFQLFSYWNSIIFWVVGKCCVLC